MNERDQELLDKQLWGVSPGPPSRGGTLAMLFIVAFLGGLLIGGILFPHKNNRIQMTTGDTPTALSLLVDTEQAVR